MKNTQSGTVAGTATDAVEVTVAVDGTTTDSARQEALILTLREAIEAYKADNVAKQAIIDENALRIDGLFKRVGVLVEEVKSFNEITLAKEVQIADLTSLLAESLDNTTIRIVTNPERLLTIEGVAYKASQNAFWLGGSSPVAIGNLTAEQLAVLKDDPDYFEIV